MNVDNLEEAIVFFESRGFHKTTHAVAHDTIDTCVETATDTIQLEVKSE